MIGAAGTCGCILAGYTISPSASKSTLNELSLVLWPWPCSSFPSSHGELLLTTDDDEGGFMRKALVLFEN